MTAGARAGGLALLWLAPAAAAVWVAGAATLPREWLGANRRVHAEMVGVAYQPREVKAALGDTIVWVNQDLIPHTATADSAPAWTTPTILSGDSAILVAGHRGEWAFTCRFHPTMKGRLIVH